MAKRKSERFVSEYFERVSGRVLDEYRPLLRELTRGHAGVYALYKQDRLYYVGLASNMMSRVNNHLRDRHKGKWDRFSVYLTTTAAHIRPLEALVLRIVNPSGNRIRGRLVGARELARPLARMMSERDKANRAALLGGHAARRRQSRKAKSASGAEALAGAFGRRMQLRGWHKGKEFVASLHRDGQIQFAGQKFDSPATAAAKATSIRKRRRFWHYRNNKKEWVPLAQLRE